MLKIDLLPQHFIIARRNKKTLILTVPILIVVALAWLAVLQNVKSNIAKTQAEYDQAKIAADAVRKLQAEIAEKEGKLAPIQAKIDFVEAADNCGGQYWDRFHEVNKYIYDRAVMSDFKITPPASCAFKVELSSTEDAGRFILDLIRCPFISGISISGGALPGGAIAANPTGTAGGAAPVTPTAAGAEAPIVFTVSCTLTQPITAPAPPGGGGAPAAGAGAPPGPGGPAGAAPGPAPAPGGDEGGGKAEKGGKKGGGEDSEGGGKKGGLKKGGGGGEDA